MFHLYSISIHNVATMSVQNRWTVCSSAHSESSPPLFGTAAGRPPWFFFFVLVSPLAAPLAADFPRPQPDDGAPRPPPRRPDRAVSSVQTVAEGGAHVRGVYFVVKRGRGGRGLGGAAWVGRGEMRQERRQRGLVRTFQLAGKEEGGGEYTEEEGGRTHRALDFEFML